MVLYWKRAMNEDLPMNEMRRNDVEITTNAGIIEIIATE